MYYYDKVRSSLDDEYLMDIYGYYGQRHIELIDNRKKQLIIKAKNLTVAKKKAKKKLILLDGENLEYEIINKSSDRIHNMVVRFWITKASK